MMIIIHDTFITDEAMSTQFVPEEAQFMMSEYRKHGEMNE